MKATEIILLRKSIRGYKTDPVPRKVLTEILETASRAPSAFNSQPWEVRIITGKVLDEVRRGNVEMLTSGKEFSPEIEPRPYAGVYRQRQVELAVRIFKLMDIARENKEKRAWWFERGFRFFDAPAAIIVLTDASIVQPLAMLDLGAFCQSICLVALDYGLSTCIEDQGTLFPEVSRKVLGIPDSKKIIISIAIGYADPDFPANNVETNREPVENFTTWYGFDKTS